MSDWLERIKARGAAAPSSTKTLVLLAVFVLPLMMLIANLPPYSTFLSLITDTVGEGEDYRHLLAYLICALILLVPGGIIIQRAGAKAIRNRSNGEND